LIHQLKQYKVDLPVWYKYTHTTGISSSTPRWL